MHVACYVLAVHGGAGTLSPEVSNLAYERQGHAGLRGALEAGHRVLEAGGAAVEAVVAAVRVLEDDDLFNAGRGSVFNAAGRQEMEAAVADGRSRVTGAVAGVFGPRNPVVAAQAVMNAMPNALMVGEGALAFLRGQVPFEDAEYFETGRRWDALQTKLALRRAGGLAPLSDADRCGSVGAVALDASGGMAAASSTGGVTGSPPGRIGDAAVVGAGIWASEACAISATGNGDCFLRAAAAHEVATRMRLAGQPLAQASEDVIELIGRRGGCGGLIAVNAAGEIAMPFNARGMYRGSIDASGRVRTAIYREHARISDRAA